VGNAVQILLLIA